MPESKGRKSVEKKKAQTAGRQQARVAAEPKASPRWWAPAMVALMVIGLVLVVMTYLSRGTLPVAGWGNWNLLLGFAIMFSGFLMTMRWR